MKSVTCKLNATASCFLQFITSCNEQQIHQNKRLEEDKSTLSQLAGTWRLFLSLRLRFLMICDHFYIKSRGTAESQHSAALSLRHNHYVHPAVSTSLFFPSRINSHQWMSALPTKCFKHFLRYKHLKPINLGKRPEERWEGGTVVVLVVKMDIALSSSRQQVNIQALFASMGNNGNSKQKAGSFCRRGKKKVVYFLLLCYWILDFIWNRVVSPVYPVP